MDGPRHDHRGQSQSRTRGGPQLRRRPGGRRCRHGRLRCGRSPTRSRREARSPAPTAPACPTRRTAPTRPRPRCRPSPMRRTARARPSAPGLLGHRPGRLLRSCGLQGGRVHRRDRQPPGHAGHLCATTRRREPISTAATSGRSRRPASAATRRSRTRPPSSPDDTGATGETRGRSRHGPCNQGCTLTPGYWKTHSRRGPAPYDDTWAQLGPSQETKAFFLSGKTLLPGAVDGARRAMPTTSWPTPTSRRRSTG